MPVDLARYVEPSAGPQVLEASTTEVSEQGLTRIPSQSVYSYLGDRPLRPSPGAADGPQGPDEVEPDGTEQQICRFPDDISLTTEPAEVQCGTLDPDDTYNAASAVNPKADGAEAPAEDVTVNWSFPLLIEAIDPAQEARLDGLDTAVTKGSYFTETQGPVLEKGTLEQEEEQDLGDPRLNSEPESWNEIPVLMADRTSMDESLQVQVDRLPPAAAELPATGTDGDTLASDWSGMPGTPVGTDTVTSSYVYQQMLEALEQFTTGKIQPVQSSTEQQSSIGFDPSLGYYLTASPVHYTARGAGLGVSTVPGESLSQVLPVGSILSGQPLGDLGDTAVRSITAYTNADPGSGTAAAPASELRLLGEFDPSQISKLQDSLGAVPMQTYFPDSATGADAASRKALGGKALLPNGNIAGLLSVPPSMITTLSSLSVLDDPANYASPTAAAPVDAAAPISVIRVKLTGALGVDATSRARLQLVAQEIHDRTGLSVDVAMGSSATPVTVEDPAGGYGRPALQLSEAWSKIGVAAVIVDAVDRKSLILSVLVLLVCALFVAGAASAAVRSRRTELGVLACLGWPARRLFRLILYEICGLGLLAGIAGCALALPLGELIGVPVDLGHAVLAIPAALLLSAGAAVLPAAKAARAHPVAALTPPVSPPRRAPARIRGIGRLALTNLRRVPGRALLGVVSLAVGVASLVFLAGITASFHGAVVGTLLGDAVTVQVHGSDYAAAVIASVLGAATIADVLYVNIRDRAAEYALLHAVGWPDRALARLVLIEAAVMGTVGSILGAGAAVAGDAVLTGGYTAALTLPALGIAAAAVLLTTLAAILPAVGLRRLPAARLLAEE